MKDFEMKNTDLTDKTALHPPVDMGRRRTAFRVLGALLVAAVPVAAFGGGVLAEEYQRSRGRSNRRNRRCPTDPRWCSNSSVKSASSDKK